VARDTGAAPGRFGPGPLGRILIVALAGDIVLAWVALQARLLFAQLVWFALGGHVVRGAEPSTAGGQLAGLLAVQRLAWLGTGILFLVWVCRAHRHLQAAGVAQVADPGEVLRAFLTPGANVVRAPRLVATLWRVSGVPAGAVGRWVAWWWGLCLASVTVDLATAVMGRGVRGLIGLEGGLGLLTLGEGLRIAAAVLGIVVVSRIDRGQREVLGVRRAGVEPPE
jgi:hypothetical protein